MVAYPLLEIMKMKAADLDGEKHILDVVMNSSNIIKVKEGLKLLVRVIDQIS